jgi:hypothetical protein
VATSPLEWLKTKGILLMKEEKKWVLNMQFPLSND